MDRRGFFRGAALAALAPVVRTASAFSLPASPVYGRSFADLQGEQVALSTFIGRPMVLNFWASWCAPCVREMPMLEAAHHRHPDLVIVGLAIDTRANVIRFLQKVTVSYVVVLGGTQGIPLMRELGDVSGGLPFSVFFDRAGQVRDSVLGELQETVLGQRLDRIL